MVLIAICVFFPFAAAALGYSLCRRREKLWNLFPLLSGAVCLASSAALLWDAAQEAFPELILPGICGAGLHFQLTGFSALYLCVMNGMWLCTSLFSGEYFAHEHKKARYLFFLLMTQGATAGVFLSADLMTTLIFFEIMSFCSYAWVVQEETPQALRAGDTYLAIAVIGGMAVLMGALLLQNGCGTLVFTQWPQAVSSMPKGRLYAAAICLIVGFGAKAGVFLLHIWLPKAHPVAPAPASALLSGMLTKTGIFGILLVRQYLLPGDAALTQALLLLGAATMLVGAFLALFSVDLKRTLACSSVSQIGFIVTGAALIGLPGEAGVLAAAGTVLYMINHSLIKLVLFQAAGVVHMRLHALDLNAIRGFGCKMPVLKLAFLSGALALSGIPLFSGYISKTLLHEALVEGAAPEIYEILFLLAGGLTLAYMTKLFVCLFVEKHPTRQAEFDTLAQKPLKPGTAAALLIPAALLPLMGVLPGVFMRPAGNLASAFLRSEPLGDFHWFSFGNLSGAAISIAIGAAVYLLFVRTTLLRKGQYVNRLPAWFDLEDTIYRPVLFKALPDVLGAICDILDTHLFEPFLRFCVQAGTLLTRCMDIVLDGSLLLLRKTVYRPLRPQREAKPIWNAQDKTPPIRNSFSFGLLVSCVGLCAVMVFLLLHVLS